MAALEANARLPGSPLQKSGAVLVALAKRWESLAQLGRATAMFRQALEAHRAGLNATDLKALVARPEVKASGPQDAESPLPVGRMRALTVPNKGETIEVLLGSPFKLSAFEHEGGLRVTVVNAGQEHFRLDPARVAADRPREQHCEDLGLRDTEPLELAPCESKVWTLPAKPCPGNGPSRSTFGWNGGSNGTGGGSAGAPLLGASEARCAATDERTMPRAAGVASPTGALLGVGAGGVERRLHAALRWRCWLGWRLLSGA